MSVVVMSAIIADEAAKSSRRNSSISTNPPNDLAADQTTIVALVDLDEEQNSISQNSLSSKSSKQRKPKHHHRSHLQAATDEPVKRSSSPDSRKKKEHSHHHHHHHHHHHQQPIINTEQEQPKLPKQLNIPTTLIVTDSNAVVIDNIDLNSISDQVFSPPPQLKSSPDQNEMGMKSTQSQTNLISSVSEVGKKRSDSKSSSIRDYSVIFPNNLDPIAGHSIDVAKLSGDYGGCCLCILFRKVFHCNCCCSKSSHQQSTQPQQQSNQPNQPTKKPNSLNSCCLLFFTQLTKYLIGFSVTLIFGVSFVAMNYLIRRTFNLRKLQRLNSTFPGPLAIETTGTKYNMDCEFCFSLIWLCTSLLTLLYPVYIMFRWVLLKIKKPKKTLRVSALFASSLNIFKNPPINNYKKIPFDSTKTDQTGAEKNRANRIYLKQNYYVKMGAITLLWLLSAYCYLRALDLLYCIDVVILFSMNYSCIYMIKWIILHHKFIPLRLLGFILSIASTIFVFYSEGFTFNLKFLGNFCVTTSAIGASILQIIWEINTRQKKNHQRIMFLTLVGFSCLVFAWPVVLILEFSFVQKIPSVLASLTSMSEPLKECIISISIACSLGFLRVFMQKFGSMFTKEIFLHMGSIIAIPLAFAIDMRINNISLSSLKTGAFICICIGYIFLVVPENLYSDVKKFFFPHESTADLSNVNISLTRKYQQNQQHQHNHSGNKPSTSPHHLQNLFAGAKSNI